MSRSPAPVSSFSSFKPILIRLSKIGSRFPIETIVSCFCLITLVYFQLLKVVRTSDFLTDPSSLSNSHSLSLDYSHSTAHWLPSTTTTATADGLHLQQIIIGNSTTVDTAILFPSHPSNCLTLPSHSQCLISSTSVSSSSSSYSYFFPSASASNQFRLNFIASIPTSIPSASQDAAAPHVVEVKRIKKHNSPFYTLSSSPSTFTTTKIARYPSFFSGRTSNFYSTRFSGVDDDQDELLAFNAATPAGRGSNGNELQSVRWIIYAIKSFVLRFWYLAKVRLFFSLFSPPFPPFLPALAFFFPRVGACAIKRHLTFFYQIPYYPLSPIPPQLNRKQIRPTFSSC